MTLEPSTGEQCVQVFSGNFTRIHIFFNAATQSKYGQIRDFGGAAK